MHCNVNEPQFEFLYDMAGGSCCKSSFSHEVLIVFEILSKFSLNDLSYKVDTDNY